MKELHINLLIQYHLMKKIIFLGAFAVCLASCATPAETVQMYVPSNVSRLVSTGKNVKVVVVDEVRTAPVIADLKVDENKLTYIYVPSKAAQAEGEENCVKCAIREALKNFGDADVIVGMETQTKFDGNYYNGHPVVESIVISGYPARYVNFRHPNNEYWSNGEYLLPAPVVADKKVAKEKEDADEGFNIELKEDGAGVAEVKVPLQFRYGKNKAKK